MIALAVSLRPGEWFCSERAATIDTILGSCLGVVMRAHGGGACVGHCILPRWDGRLMEAGAEARFVDQCFARMFSFFDRRGIARAALEVKLFGGAQMLPFASGGRTLSVGRQNIDMAVDILGREGVRIGTQDVGGRRGRRIIVDTATGEVRVRYLQSIGEVFEAVA